MNGTTDHYSADELAPKPETEKVYRSHDAAREIPATAAHSNAEIAKAMKAHLERLDQITSATETVADRMEKVSETLLKAMSRRDAPAAAISSPNVERPNVAEAVALHVKHAKLKPTVLENGDVSYSLPVDNALDRLNWIVSDREAFIERGPTLTGAPAHIEVTSATDRAIEAAMLHAKAKWGDDQIMIHASQKHAELVVKHAVAQGLTIANKDPRILELVAIERERQTNPLVRGRDLETPLIERVSSATSRER